jgi:type IV secretory pathway VirD2 relaxase
MKLPNPEEIMHHYGIDTGEYLKDQQVLKAIRHTMRETRNIALEWAAENAKVTIAYPRHVVDKRSILRGKIHKDLNI